jgi:hypothetical protein
MTGVAVESEKAKLNTKRVSWSRLAMMKVRPNNRLRERYK